MSKRKVKVGNYDCPILKEIQEALWVAGAEDGVWADCVEKLITMNIHGEDLDDYEFVDRYDGGEYMNALYTVFKWKGQMYKVDYRSESHYGTIFEDYLVEARPVTQKTKEVFYYE